MVRSCTSSSVLAWPWGRAVLGTFQGKATQPSFHLGEEAEQGTLPTGS